VTRRRRISTLLAASLLLMATSLPVTRAQVPTERIAEWWQYDPSMWGHGFSAHPELAKEHQQWHDQHPNAGRTKHEAFHEKLTLEHRQLHYHAATDAEAGQATWYDAQGATGACGKPLKGMYVAHKTWPCGALVSVRVNGKYVFVPVLDRGPYGKGRIVDLSPEAFKKLAPLSTGVIDVRATLLKR
jgi:rare lipoprotein A